MALSWNLTVLCCTQQVISSEVHSRKTDSNMPTDGAVQICFTLHLHRKQSLLLFGTVDNYCNDCSSQFICLS